jgi:hypothetical protein
MAERYSRALNNGMTPIIGVEIGEDGRLIFNETFQGKGLEIYQMILTDGTQRILRRRCVPATIVKIHDAESFVESKINAWVQNSREALAFWTEEVE